MKKNKKLLSVSITSTSYFDIKKTIDIINKSDADRIHFDVMDGVFVPNITYGMDFISSVKPYSQKFFDVHLMIINPLPYIKSFFVSGSDLISVHIEAKNCLKSLKLIKSLGIKSGVVINPKTSYKKILKYLDFVDEILVMSVEPGFGGQKFIEKVADKVLKISSLVKKKGKNILVQVDGGINFETAKKVFENGANSVVVGSFLFKQKDFNDTVFKIKNM
ncbi:ribulose-phosphate 3-epimerase [bacterium]|nr:ribulose-phosphate 3-epimerase [bacterium]